MSQSTRLSWLLAIFVVAVLPSSAFAVETIKTESVQAEDIRLSTQGKEEVVQRPIVVATTDIRDPQIVAKNGADVTLLFTLFNAEGVQSGVVYGVELRQDNRLVDVSHLMSNHSRLVLVNHYLCHLPITHRHSFRGHMRFGLLQKQPVVCHFHSTKWETCYCKEVFKE